MIDIKKTIRRLLSLSQKVLDEIDVLSNLSYNDRENTSQFNDHVTNIKDYLNQEKVILNNISLGELTILFKELQNYDDDSDAYLRCFDNVDNKLNDLLDKEESSNNENDCLDEEVELTDSETIEDEDIILLEKYHVDEEETEKYAITAIDYISTIVIKKMLVRIMNTLTDNKQDNKYKKTLIKNFKKFKYFYFTLDNKLELLGAQYRFDIEKIPNPYAPSIDTSRIFHNQCVIILSKLYEAKHVDYTPDKMEEMLFNMMTFEEYLKGIDSESVNRLIELIDDLEHKYGANYFGNIAKQKVLSRKN